MSFASPWFLLLLPLLGAVPMAMRFSLTQAPRRQLLATAIARTLILLLLILALAGLRLQRPSRSTAVTFLLDRSASIGTATAENARERLSQLVPSLEKRGIVSVITFAGSPHLLAPARPVLELPDEWPTPAQPDKTNGAAAIGFASALFPAEARKHLVLLSDGNFTDSGTLEAARQAHARGITIDVLPLVNAPAPEVLIERLEAPRRVQSKEPFDLTAHLRSSVATSITARLFLNQFMVAEVTREVTAGRSRIQFPDVTVGPATTAAEVEIVPAQDTRLENNRATASIVSEGQPRVLIVDSAPDQIRPLAAALQTEDFDAQVRGADGLPRSLDDLQQFDVFLLSDVSALQLSQGQMDLYRSWVQDFGGGFAMLGGENSFGVGGYFRTPIEQLLPVRMEHDDRIETPTVALLIVLDRSGSMSAPVAGQTKMSLANQGAVFAMEALQQRDLFGVIAVDTVVHPVRQLSPLSSGDNARARILSVTAGGGGIYVFTSLLESFRQLRPVDARIKHVILFSDARDAEEKSAGDHSDGAAPGSGNSLDIVAGMLANRITTSVVALGDEIDKDVEFLKQLAARGSGRFYLTNDARTLPQIFSTETLKVAQSSLLEEPFLPIPAQAGPATAGINWIQAPLLLGYNATKPKPTADLLLATERGDPLLATWRVGLGKVAAFTSDAKSRWAGEWQSWGGYGRFWAQLSRSLLSRTGRSPLQIEANFLPGSASVPASASIMEVNINAATPDGQFLDDQELNVALRSSGSSETRQQEAVQIAPGQYRAQFDPAPTEGATLSVGSPGSELPPTTIGLSLPLAPEFLHLEPDLAALRSIAAAGGGRLLADGDTALSPAPANLAAPENLQPWLLIAALLLLPLDIWFRRRDW